MHTTAHELGKAFFELYWRPDFRRILEVGSMDVTASLRSYCPPDAEYVGVNTAAGQGVDLVLADPYKLPFGDASFDMIVSTSCFEHDQMFWLTFLELARVLQPDGVLYINAPSNGAFHRFPFDNWRFYPDAAWALSEWAARNNVAIQPVESFICGRKVDHWNDCVMVFAKRALVPERYLCSTAPRAYNVLHADRNAFANFSGDSEDMIMLGRMYDDNLGWPEDSEKRSIATRVLRSPRSPDPTQIRVLATMPLLFRPPRLHHWFDQIRCLAEMGLEGVHVHVITSAFELEQKRKIANLLRPFQSPAFTAEIESFWNPEDPTAMTWQHKKLFDSTFLGSGRFTHFVYLEDDLRFTWTNLAYWLRYRDVLKPHGFIPAFVRYEYNMLDHDLYLSDCVAPTQVGQSPLLVDGEVFVTPHNPYCAMYVMDQELGEEYRRSRSFDRETSQTVSGWPSTERSAMGLCFDPVPPGRLSRFLVPFDIGRRLPHLGALVHHLPNNFASRQFPIEGFEHQHGALKLTDGFV